MSELKKCPFCGSEEINIETVGNFSWGECCACGATSRDFRLDASFNPLQRVDGAEVYWNTRLLEDALLARAEKAEGTVHNQEVCLEAYRQEVVDLTTRAERAEAEVIGLRERNRKQSRLIQEQWTNKHPEDAPIDEKFD